MAFDTTNYGRAVGAAGIGTGLYNMFFGGNDNPSDDAMKYLDKIPGQVKPYYEPYIEAGRRSMPISEGEYGSLINNPGGKLNQIGANFQESPGFKFALQQALQGANHAAAAGGMAGSPEHEYENMQLATNLGNQDYYNWLKPATELYGAGLTGEEGIGERGFNASKGFSDQIAQLLAQKANLSYAGQQSENQSRGADISNIIGGAGMLAAFL